MKTMKGYLGTFAAVSLLLAAGAVSAAPIAGDVTFTGDWEAQNADGTNATIGSAARIHFLPGVTVALAIGDFAGAEGALVDYTSFTFDPFEGPIAPLWSFEMGGTVFSFNLEAVTKQLQISTNLVLTGTGTAFATGYDPTEFVWTFSGDSTQALLSFSASAFSVPEPSVVGLLGLGLIAMGAVGVRRRNAARKA
ncbi:MAG: PEP-CTERM sorting domain-containing protein [Wenzhouxiangellaceae bacterium]